MAHTLARDTQLVSGRTWTSQARALSFFSPQSHLYFYNQCAAYSQQRYLGQLHTKIQQKGY